MVSVRGLGSNEILSEAVFNGDKQKTLAKLESHLKSKEKEFNQINNKLHKFIKSLDNYKGNPEGFFTERLMTEISSLEFRREKLQTEITGVNEQVNSFPTAEEVHSKREIYNDLIKCRNASFLNSGVSFMSLPFQEKQKIIRLIMGGKDQNGEKYGIHIKPVGGRPKRYSFQVYGRLGFIDGSIISRTKSNDEPSSFSDDIKFSKEADILNTVAEVLVKHYPDLATESKGDAKVKQDVLGERHAYHRLGVYQRRRIRPAP
jgi:hypothetical protein